MVVISCCHGRSPPEGRNICIIVPWSGSDTVLRVAILHLGIGRPLAALPDPLEAAAVHKRGPHPMGVLHPIGLLRHRRITFFATLSVTLCWEADISCPKVQLSHNRLAQHNGCSLCASALGTRRTLWSLSKATTSLVHVVAANWSLGTQLKAPQPDHS
jgi:hypothetical protein